MTATPSWVMTYDSLTSTVLQYLERSDPAVVAAIPTFITLCEFEIAQEIKTLGQLTVATATMQTGNPNLAKPARWRKTVSMSVNNGTSVQPVLVRKFEYLKNYWPDVTKTGTPIYYSDTDYEHWYLAPTPDQDYEFEILYYERIAPLSSTNQTNWLTQYAPNAMLYGTLLQAMPFLKNDSRAIFQQKYSEAIAALKTEDVSRVADRQAIAVDS
jgi:branched-subunit amino acid transport protein AzlD